MEVMAGAITDNASQGRITLQVPQVQLFAVPRMVHLPDEWFIRLSSNRIPSKEGFLYLSRKGYLANKAELKKAYLGSFPGADWNDFEKYADTFYQEIEAAIAKRVATLQKQVDRLAAHLESIAG